MADAPDKTAEDKFVAARPPLLGYSIEWNARRGLYRLVRHDDAPDVVTTGTLDECETALIAGLKEEYGTGHLNLPFFTLGGKQFWADLFVFGDWRIQENVYTGHCRLLDPSDIRQAWGTYEGCRVAFEDIRREQKLKPAGRHLVIILHGIDRSKDMMTPIAAAVEKAGFATARINYPSTRRSLAEHARQIERVLDNTIDADTVSFVTHSMGGLVARKTLELDSDWRKRIKLGRVVMIAPPSQGAKMADLLKDFMPYKLFYGPSGQGLVGAEARGLPVPPCSFGIIAGRRGTQDGYNPLIPGDDDGIVGVSETRLPGADDFLLVKANHATIVTNKEALDAAVNFLKTGKFAAPRGVEIERRRD